MPASLPPSSQPRNLPQARRGRPQVRYKCISYGRNQFRTVAHSVKPYFTQRNYCRKRITSTLVVPPSILATMQFNTGAPWTSTCVLRTHTAWAKLSPDGSALRRTIFHAAQLSSKAEHIHLDNPSLHPHNRAIYHRRAVDVHKCVTNTSRSGEINFGRCASASVRRNHP